LGSAPFVVGYQILKKIKKLLSFLLKIGKINAAKKSTARRI